MTLECDCEPEVFLDGSKLHELECAVYPWCPHEMGAYACPPPCGCKCGPCAALSEYHKRI